MDMVADNMKALRTNLRQMKAEMSSLDDGYHIVVPGANTSKFTLFLAQHPWAGIVVGMASGMAVSLLSHITIQIH